MSDTSTSTRSHVGAAFDRVTSTAFIFAMLSLAVTVLLIGPGEAAGRAAAGYRAALQVIGF